MGLDVTLTLLLLSEFGFICCFPSVRRFFYIDTLKNWTDAQLHCKQKFTDLATLRSTEEVDSLTRQSDMKGLVWIGLRDDPASWKGTMGSEATSWRWSASAPTLSAGGYQNWKSGQPDFIGGRESCVSMGSDGKWSDDNCASLKTFVCYRDVAPNVKTYDFVSTPMTWTDAQAHCRTHHTELPVVSSADDNTQVLAALPALNGSWLALFREPYAWSDGSSRNFTNWKLDEPNNGRGDQPCVAENNAHQWADFFCRTTLPFLCHADPVRQSSIKMMITMSANWTDSAINAQIVEQLAPSLGSELVYKLLLKWNIQPEETKEEFLELPCLKHA